MRRRPFIAALLALALAACSSNVYRKESFRENSPYQARFAATPAATCEAARRALLSQGYALAPPSGDSISGSKVFQPDEDEHIVLDVTVVCVAVDGGSMAYANAVQTDYALKEKSDSAGLSVSRLGSISLPWGSTKDSLVKVGAKTVEDPDFYARFFALMGHHAPRAMPAKPDSGASGGW